MKRLGLCVAVALGISLLGVEISLAADAMPAGQKIFLENKCTSCHSLKAAKIEKRKVESAEEGEAGPAGTAPKKVPPDLSGTGLRHNAEWIQGWLMKKEMIDGKKHRKMFRGTPDQLKTLANWLAGMKTKTDGTK